MYTAIGVAMPAQNIGNLDGGPVAAAVGADHHPHPALSSRWRHLQRQAVERALRRPDLLLRVTALQSPFILGLGVAGAFWRGAPGAAEGFALAQSVGAVTIWVLFLRADGRPRDFGGASAPAST